MRAQQYVIPDAVYSITVKFTGYEIYNFELKLENTEQL